VQQAGGKADGRRPVSAPGDLAEQDADRCADLVLAGRTCRVSARVPAPAMQCHVFAIRRKLARLDARLRQRPKVTLLAGTDTGFSQDTEAFAVSTDGTLYHNIYDAQTARWGDWGAKTGTGAPIAARALHAVGGPAAAPRSSRSPTGSSSVIPAGQFARVTSLYAFVHGHHRD
jgi:hypothetical protein